tara:strand:- start:1583 stop:2203 length:621 start_codon:yes stop_codon:yes gene_type:complete
MIFKNLLRILESYRLSLVKIIFFELLYLIKGYKGNGFAFSENNIMADNIPCPYYFLHKIKKKITDKDFNIFLDMGCGSGRVINFFNKNFTKKNFIGIEYFEKQFLQCKKNLEKYENIKLFQLDFIKNDFLQYNADCYFFNHPIKDDIIFSNLIKKILNSVHNKKSILLIFVNCNNSILKSLDNVQLIESYYVNDDKGFSIYCINNK